MAPHRGKLCVKKILKLDAVIAGKQACRTQASRSTPQLRPVVLKWLIACKSIGKIQSDAGVTVDDEQIEMVEHFKYIGSLKSASSSDTVSSHTSYTHRVIF